MKILVSGASGFLGSQVVKFFVLKKNEVTAMIRKDSDTESLKELGADIVLIGDNYSPASVIRDLKPDVIINTVADYGKGKDELGTIIDSNIKYPAELLDAVIENNIKLMVHIGTSLPHGVSLYAQTKNAFIDIAKMKFLGESKFINIEQEYFYGLDEPNDRFLTSVIDKCIKGKDVDLTHGLQVRDFISIHDVLSAYECILERSTDFEEFTTIPVGSGERVTIRDVVNNIHMIANSKSALHFGAIPDRNKEGAGHCADTKFFK